MIIVQGKGVSKGIAEGPLYFLQKPDTTIVKETGKDIDAEKARIAEAKEKSAAQLMALAEKCREEAGDDAAFVFETHAMFLDDDDYVEGINDCLESEQCNAEYAVRTSGDAFAAMFAAMDDAYMSARAADIKDITYTCAGINHMTWYISVKHKGVELRDKLQSGDAENYGAYAAETMMETAYGKEEILESKIERLKQVVGEELAGEIKKAMEGVGGLVDSLAEMDEGKFSALVSGLKVIAGAGGGLMSAGLAFRLIGTLLTPAGGLGLGLIALTAAATAIEKLRQADLRDTFGDMQIDKEGITSYVKSLGEDFRAAYEATDEFQKALGLAVENYRGATETFSTNLFSMMITDAKLTPTDLKGLLDIASQVQEYAKEALKTASDGDAEYWVQLFGGDEEALNDPVYQSIIEKTNEAYEKNKEELEGIGKGLREAITEAFADEKLDQDEYDKLVEDLKAQAEAEAAEAEEAPEAPSEDAPAADEEEQKHE